MGFRRIFLCLAALLLCAATACADTLFVTTQNGKTVNMRSGPGMKHKILMRIPNGYSVETEDELDPDGWLLCTYEGHRGYINGQYLSEAPGAINGYVVSDLVKNTISLTSYMSSFFSSLFSMGVAFELPAVVLVLSELGLIDREFLKKYRKHALVVILIIAAFITPADLLSMFIVALPLYLLYEFSILICKKGENSENEAEV